MRATLFFLVISCFFNACQNVDSPVSLQAEEYVKWMNDPKNGFIQKKEVNGLVYSVQKRTADYQYAIKNSTDYQDTAGLDQYVLRIEALKTIPSLIEYGLESDVELRERISYLSFGFKEDIKLKNDAGEVNCGVYQFIRNYNTAPFLEFVFAFPVEPKEDYTLVITDKIFNNGPLKFKFNNHQPRLKK